MIAITYAQNFEDVLLGRALSDVPIGSYIDIGAHHPVIESVSKAFYDLGWHGIHVEPVQIYADMLRRDRPADIVLQVAASNRIGLLTFYEIPETGLSTADPKVAKKHRDAGYVVKSISVPAVTLDSILDTVDGEIHWLKIDVEGHEREVLEGWRSSSKRPWIVIIESTYPTTTQRTHDRWEDLILGKSYILAHEDGLNRYYVCAGRDDLAERLRHGPNVFDHFEAAERSWLVKGVRERFEAAVDELQARTTRLQAELATAREEIIQAITASVDQQAQAKRAMDLRIVQFQVQADRDVAANATAMQRVLEECLARERTVLERLIDRETRATRVEQEILSAAQRERQHHATMMAIAAERDAAHAKCLTLEVHNSQLNARLEEGARGHREVKAGLEQALSQMAKAKVEAEVRLDRFAEQKAEIGKRLEDTMRELGEAARAHAALNAAVERENRLHAEHAAEVERLTHIFRTNESALQELLEHAQEQLSAHVRLFDERDRALRSAVEVRDALVAQLTNERSALSHAQEQLSAHVRLFDERERGLRSEVEARDALVAQLTNERSALSVRVERATAALLSRETQFKESQEIIRQFLAAPWWQRRAHFERLKRSLSSEPAIPALGTGTPEPSAPQISDTGPSVATTINHISRVDQLLAYYGAPFVNQVYRALLGRSPDDEGLRYYMSRLRAGAARESVIAQVARSSEARLRGSSLSGLAQVLRDDSRDRHWLWKHFSWRERLLRACAALGYRLHEHAEHTSRELADLSAKVQRIEQAFRGQGALHPASVPDVSSSGAKPGAPIAFNRTPTHVEQFAQALAQAKAVIASRG